MGNGKLRVFEGFSGYGSQSLQLNAMGIPHEVVGTSEVDTYAIVAYSATHDSFRDIKGVGHDEMRQYLQDRNIGYDFKKGMHPNLTKKRLESTYSAALGQNCYGDITLLEAEELPDMDLFTYSFPCFVKGTLIMTSKGFKKIEDITCDDKVLTHTNMFQRVVKPMTNYADHIYRVRSMCGDDILVTEEHPFYTRGKSRVWNKEKKSYERVFSKPRWTKTKNLTKDEYLGVAINQKSEIPEWDGVEFKWSDGRKTRKSNKIKGVLDKYDFWWIIGRYIGDGWLRHQGGIIISTPRGETNDIVEKLDKLGFNSSVSQERTVNKVHISFKEMGMYCEQFGRGAANKRLTEDILDLPCNLLKGFLDGYISADGCLVKGYYKATTVSRELIHGIGQCVAKVYKRPFSIGYTKNNSTCVIEGRTVNQLPSYTISWKPETSKFDKAFYENGYIWCPINKIEMLEYKGLVYNMEVEHDNSYTANGIIVHNCQDISVAGLGKGLTEDSNTRSSLLWECRKVIKGKKPKFLMMENVKNLLSEKHKKDFDKWLEWLESEGYNNYYKVINAKNCGVPQNRERVFLVSILKDIDDGSFHFEDDFDSGLRLRDILDQEVDNKFYIKTEKAKKLLESLQGKEIIPGGINISRQGEVFDKNVDVASCLLARDYKGLGNQSMTAVAEPVIVASRGRNTSGDKSYTQELEFNGTENTNTITTVQKDNLVLSPKRLGGLFDKDGKKRQAGAVWDKECLAPTIDTCQGGYREPIVVVDKEDTHSLKFIGGLDSNKRIEDGKNLSRNYKEGYRVYDVDGIATCQKSSGGGLGGCTGLYQTEYSIRRLTPRECLRLMGLTEGEINKIQDSGISDTQQYKLAGNSIVKPCMAFLKNLPLHKLKQSN